MSTPGPGWHQDPARPAGHLRYWDGRRWTEAVATPPPAAAGRPAPYAAPPPLAQRRRPGRRGVHDEHAPRSATVSRPSPTSG
ncbi:DUF2510 domain-containing protein [Nocardioides sp. Leaf374]|uniref:DUF2510 domain-containing protein n=1 Tax=Nocardioides sp. Leaf374 TaxID=2876560 RepID=UPI003A5CF069